MKVKDYILNVDCQCGSEKCLHRYLCFGHDSNDDMVYMDLQSYRWEPFWKRCIEAFKYLFGKGDLTWVGVIPNKEQIPDLIEFLQKSQNSKKELTSH